MLHCNHKHTFAAYFSVALANLNNLKLAKNESETNTIQDLQIEPIISYMWLVRQIVICRQNHLRVRKSYLILF